MNVSETVKGVNDVIEQDRKLKFGEKLSVAINGGTGTFHNQMIQMFLLFFYSDILKISMTYVATLFIVVRVADAVLAPMFGIFIDKISTPWGKYKPWYIGIGMSIGLFGWLTFTNVNLSPTGKIIYATITYFLYSTFKTIEMAPGGALIPAFTKRIDDRISISQISNLLFPIAGLIVVAAVPPLYKGLGRGDDARGFSLIMGGVFVITILISIWQMFVIKERYIVNKSNEDKNKKSPSLKEMFSAVISNKTALIVYIGSFSNNLANGLRAGATIYFFKYFFHNEALMAITGVIGVVPSLLGILLSGKVTKRIGIKPNILLGTIVGSTSALLMVFVPPTQIGVIMFVVLMAVGGFFGGVASSANGTMLPAAIDYTEWKTGKNISALLSSVNGFLSTLSTAISGSLVALLLTAIGYVGGAPEQSSSAVFGIKMLYTLIPTIIGLASLSVIWFDLTEDKQAEITKDLAERRKKAEENATV